MFDIRLQGKMLLTKVKYSTFFTLIQKINKNTGIQLSYTEVVVTVAYKTTKVQYMYCICIYSNTVRRSEESDGRLHIVGVTCCRTKTIY